MGIHVSHIYTHKHTHIYDYDSWQILVRLWTLKRCLDIFWKPGSKTASRDDPLPAPGARGSGNGEPRTSLGVGLPLWGTGDAALSTLFNDRYCFLTTNSSHLLVNQSNMKQSKLITVHITSRAVLLDITIPRVVCKWKLKAVIKVHK